jgi:hypothetical protein
VSVTATDLVTVNSALSAGSVTPSAPSIDNGQSITLTANPTGGTTPYSYSWSDVTCTEGQTSQTCTTSPSSTTMATVQVTDSAYSHVSDTATDTITVNS